MKVQVTVIFISLFTCFSCFQFGDGDHQEGEDSSENHNETDSRSCNIVISNSCKPSSSKMLPCGTLLDMKSNDPYNPLTPGFPSGVYLDGSTVFPGTGNYENCDGTRVARISAARSGKGFGAYSPCSSENYDFTSAKYFKFHPNLNWVSTDFDSASKIPGVIKVFTKTQQLLHVARITLSTDMTKFNQIGIHWVAGSKVIFWNGYKNLEENISKANGMVYEVLVCTP